MFNISYISRIISSMANGKAAGIDKLSIEPIKIGLDILLPHLFALFYNCFKYCSIPNDWHTGLIVPIFKSGDRADIKNYRPITLTCTLRRVYEKCINVHIYNMIDSQLTPNQGGFRKHSSCLDSVERLNGQILSLNKRNLQPSKTVTGSRGLILTFLDIKKAYDTVDRSLLYKKMEKMNIPIKFIRVIFTLFEDNVSNILLNGDKSSNIYLQRGLLQGSSLSPILFNIYINDLSHELNECADTVGGMNDNHYLFADDISLLSINRKSAQHLLDICVQWGIKNRIQFATHKCEFISNINNCTLQMNNVPLRRVSEYKYLGIYIGVNGILMQRSFEERIKGMEQLCSFFQSKGMHINGYRIKQSVLIYKTFLRPMIEYGLSLNIIDNSILNILQNAQNKVLRTMMSVGPNACISSLHLISGVEKIYVRNYILVLKKLRNIANFKHKLPIYKYTVSKINTDHKYKKLYITATNQANTTADLKKYVFQTKIDARSTLISTISSQLIVLLIDENKRKMFLRMISSIDRLYTQALILWITSGLHSRQICPKCGLKISRTHLQTCYTSTWPFGDENVKQVLQKLLIDSKITKNKMIMLQKLTSWMKEILINENENKEMLKKIYNMNSDILVNISPQNIQRKRKFEVLCHRTSRRNSNK